MGSGKSHIGRLVAVRLGWLFTDTDEMVAAAFQMPVTDIFELKGEEVFRMAERNALNRIAGDTLDRVVATGGGMPCFFDNTEVMKRSGWIIFLDPPVQVLVARLIPELRRRPVLKGQREDTLSAFIAQLLSHRRKYYEQAHCIITASDEGEVMDMITAFISDSDPQTLNLK